MKVIHIISSMGINSGGPTTCTYELIKGLIDQGINSNVLTYLPDAGDRLISDVDFIHTVVSPMEKRFGYSVAFKTALRSFTGMEIIHANGLWQYTSITAAKIAKRKGIPFVLSPHGMLYPAALNTSKWIKKASWYLYQRRMLLNATVLHATCVQELEHIRGLGIKTPVAVIPNPIEKNQDIQNQRLKDTRSHIGFIGRFAPIKNIENLIHAWAQVGKDRADWELVLIGDGVPGYRKSLKELAEKLEVKNIIFPGFLDGKAKNNMLNSLSYLVLPSKSENFGMVVPEALVREIPVIASKGTPWEELNTRKAGWWIEIGAQPLAETLTQAMSLSETERHAMGQNGRKLVEENYSIEVVASKMIELYQWILKQGQKPDFIYE